MSDTIPNKRLLLSDYEALQSKTMDFLRFHLMIAVCFIHVNQPNLINMHPSTPAFAVYFLISQVITRLAVPLFFIISGYYFFFNKDNKQSFSISYYLSKLKKRTNTLLVPYLLWNLFVLLFRIFTDPYIRHYATTLPHILSAFCYWNGGKSPIAFQFWFIRDLIYMCILSPIVFLLLRNKNIIAISLLCLLWFMDLDTLGRSASAVFFFSLGAFFSINNLNIIKTIAHLPRKSVYISTFILMVFDLLLNISPTNKPHTATNNPYIHNLFLLFGIVCVLLFVSTLIERRIKAEKRSLSQASFFLFAIHVFPLQWLNTFLIRILPQNDLSFLFNYFVCVPTIAVLSVFAYKILKRHLPKTLSILTGGR